MAPPDRHIIVRPGHLHLEHGPRENFARPGIDVLFRSAAAAYASRVTGVVLTGTMDDGTAGLVAVKRCGGLAVVQDPRDAPYPEMPLSALQHVDVDHVSSLSELGSLLTRLVQVEARPAPPIPRELLLEIEIAEGRMEHADRTVLTKSPSPYTCPECGGSLFEIRGAKVVRYRCRVGHAFSEKGLLAGQTDHVEGVLWEGVRALQEQRSLLRSLLHRARGAGRDMEAASYERTLSQLDAREEHLRRLLVDREREPGA